MNTTILFAGLAGMLAGAWGRVQGWFSQLASLVFVRAQIAGNDLKTAIKLYTTEQLQPTRARVYRYFVTRQLVRTEGLVREVLFRSLGMHEGTLIWDGWRPLWVYEGQMGENRGYDFTIAGIRGLTDLQAFLVAAIDYLRERRGLAGAAGRFRIHHVTGRSRGMDALADVLAEKEGQTGNKRYLGGDDGWDLEDGQPTNFHLEDLGLGAGEEELDRVALPDGGRELVEDLEQMLSDAAWFRSRGLAWRRGYLLYGDPGNGKSMMIRALARRFDLPVFLFDLSTLTNNELRAGWAKAREQAPCLAVVEDLDAVFSGRENLVEGSTLTFDALLNVIDGVDAADGIIFFATTNRPECLDDALGGHGHGSDLGTRPGRIDRTLHLGAPDAAGRRKIASRVLGADHPELGAFLRDADGLSGAQIQEGAVRLALQHRERKGTKCET